MIRDETYRAFTNIRERSVCEWRSFATRAAERRLESPNSKSPGIVIYKDDAAQSDVISAVFYEPGQFARRRKLRTIQTATIHHLRRGRSLPQQSRLREWRFWSFSRFLPSTAHDWMVSGSYVSIITAPSLRWLIWRPQSGVVANSAITPRRAAQKFAADARVHPARIAAALPARFKLTPFNSDKQLGISQLGSIFATLRRHVAYETRTRFTTLHRDIAHPRYNKASHFAIYAIWGMVGIYATRSPEESNGDNKTPYGAARSSPPQHNLVTSITSSPDRETRPKHAFESVDAIRRFPHSRSIGELHGRQSEWQLGRIADPREYRADLSISATRRIHIEQFTRNKYKRTIAQCAPHLHRPN